MTVRELGSIVLGIGSGLPIRHFALAALPLLAGLALRQGLRTYADAIDLYAGDE
jgi:hypothetical protein